MRLHDIGHQGQEYAHVPLWTRTAHEAITPGNDLRGKIIDIWQENGITLGLFQTDRFGGHQFVFYAKEYEGNYYQNRNFDILRQEVQNLTYNDWYLYTEHYLNENRLPAYPR